ncbi:MAG: hypothetical protein JHC95_22505, partial [Solirubrobacteraceae bacterium]|nr:hypothetical protein [Solirubrobacteraceae bacterium]
PSITITYEPAPGGGGGGTPPAGDPPATGGGPPTGGTGGATSTPLATARFTGSKTSAGVNRERRFTFTFLAPAGTTGTATFASTAKVKIAAKRKLTLLRAPFTVPAAGKVTVKGRLSKKTYATLRLNRKIRTKVTVTLRNAAGQSSTASTTLTLSAPR